MLPICISIVLAGLFPSTGWSATATGGTKTTMVLNPSGASYWCMRVDPPEVSSFQLSVSFDPARAMLDTSFANNGIQFKFPFNGTIMFEPDIGAYKVFGEAPPEVTAPGDADVFELKFLDLQPGIPLDQAPFTVFAIDTDFIDTYDPVTGQSATITAADILPTTRVATPGVSPLIWDPDLLYNNGRTGGSGDWNTSALGWDNLPVPPEINSGVIKSGAEGQEDDVIITIMCTFWRL